MSKSLMQIVFYMVKDSPELLSIYTKEVFTYVRRDFEVLNFILPAERNHLVQLLNMLARELSITDDVKKCDQRLELDRIVNSVNSETISAAQVAQLQNILTNKELYLSYREKIKEIERLSEDQG